ncbi:unnamed protein product [Timema podura]|uniref:Uncharacterized protein n=1 Tax=Timema podura TaxID=61482 RepID=A0ABN7P533_TIMPD|nr:unnamed protein product [Timema podura]
MFSLTIKICLLVSLMVSAAYSDDADYEESEECCVDQPTIVEGVPKSDLYYIYSNRCEKLIPGYVIESGNKYKTLEKCEYCRERNPPKYG